MIRKVMGYGLWVMGLIVFLTHNYCFAQDTTDLEFTLDINSGTASLPNIFKPNIDLSGRGFYRQQDWPKTLAAGEVLDTWQKDIGFSGIYRLQYNLWEINAAGKNKGAQEGLLNNYENIIKRINDAGGIVILNIFGTPAGLGKVLDQRSTPVDLRAFKELVKGHIRNLSCDKRYNIWYEAWSAPDLDDFFLGKKQEYLNLYRAIAEGIKELESETKVHIPLGGPGVSWWFKNLDENTIVTPEKSLIYELIKFCAHYNLPLNFISWHAYSADPKTEKREINVYHKTALALIKDWLSYFRLPPETPLIITEWNYDSSSNVLPGRGEKAYICASYIPGRLKNMYEAGLDYQFYFSLEDFRNNKEGVVRNTGIFSFDSESSRYKGMPKCTYNVFRMLGKLENNIFLSPAKINDEFAGVVATRNQESVAILIYNYIDTDIAIHYLSKNIATLNDAERKVIVNLVKSERLGKIIRRQLDISKLRLSSRLKNLLKKAQELDEQAEKFKDASRNMKLVINNLKENYLYQRYTVDSSCSADCEFVPAEEKETGAPDTYQETLTLKPYSVNLLILKKKPKEPEPAPSPISGQAQTSSDGQ